MRRVQRDASQQPEIRVRVERIHGLERLRAGRPARREVLPEDGPQRAGGCGVRAGNWAVGGLRGGSRRGGGGAFFRAGSRAGGHRVRLRRALRDAARHLPERHPVFRGDVRARLEERPVFPP